MSYSNNLIKMFQELVNSTGAKRTQGYQFKIAMYRKAMKAIKENPSINATSVRSLMKTTFKNPKKILEKLDEFEQSGTLKTLNEFRSNETLQLKRILASIPFVGPVKANKLLADGITSISNLKTKQELLTKQQKIALKYYNELINKNTLNAVRIPRSEIEKFDKMIKIIANKHNFNYEISGSYRRGAESSGDIDVLISAEVNPLSTIIEGLKRVRILTDEFSYGKAKWLGMGKISNNTPHRRIDFFYSSPDEYPFHLLYSTGSAEFNKEMREYAKQKGYRLNEHSIKSLNGNVINTTFRTEKDIFDFLKLKYIPPKERKQGALKSMDPKTNSRPPVVNIPKMNPALDIFNIYKKNISKCEKGEALGGYKLKNLQNIAKKAGINIKGLKKTNICRKLKNKATSSKMPNETNGNKATSSKMPNETNGNKATLSKMPNETNGNKATLSKMPNETTKKYNVSKGVTLANVYKENTDPTGMYISEKYDGIRAIFDGQNLRSRTNKKISAPQWFINSLPKNFALDGELIVSNGTFQETTSTIMKKVPIENEWRKVKYIVFDVPSMENKPYKNRYQFLQNYFKNKTNGPIVIAKQNIVTSKSFMKNKYANVIAKGGEGVMLRNASMKYTPKRTQELLKVKPTMNNEAIIMNLIEGKGKNIGKLGALQVRMLKDPSKVFKVGSGFTNVQRQEIWKNKNSMKNRAITYQYKGLTSSGLPRHPVFMRFRTNNV